jgi:beta-lactamase regulating signal transducer with metallopeptidase domain
MLFNSDWFSRVPENPAVYIIAHELAHVHDWATAKLSASVKDMFGANDADIKCAGARSPVDFAG